MAGTDSVYLNNCLERLQRGDESARADLLAATADRLLHLTRMVFRDHARLRRWQDSDDVRQGAWLRLHRALGVVTPPTLRDFYRLATTHIRRELIDLSRHYFGPEGLGRHHDSVPARPENESSTPVLLDSGGVTLEPGRLADWTEFHKRVDDLPDDEREVFDLVWYQGLQLKAAAELLAVSPRTITRRWQAACLKLHDALPAGISPNPAPS